MVRVRFSEVDSLRIVWHGHFLKYFEDGRAAFGHKYGLSYQDFLNAGLIVPVVHASCDHLQPARYGDELAISTRLYEQEAAKIFYYYEVTRAADGALLATGETIQAFLDTDLILLLTLPDFMRSFYDHWKEAMLTHG
jgi:acyl-CoA thioester hydrolase